MKMKQYTVVNPETIMTMSRHAETSLAGDVIMILKASIEIASE